jgi:hypothetical protein
LDHEYALDCIREIRPVQFKYIENNKPEIGFIAQHIESSIPEAVNIKPGFLPNILCHGNINKIDSDTYEVFLDKIIDTTSITLPACVKLQKNDIINTDCFVKAIKNDQYLTIKGNLENIIDDNNRVYIYGTYIDDFRVLSKDVIFTYTVSAVKQLDTELQELKFENNQLKEKVSNMKKDFKEMKDILLKLNINTH